MKNLLLKISSCALLSPLMPSAFADGLNLDAGPIWSHVQAISVCPSVCSAKGGAWNGHWWTSIPGSMSVCQCNSITLGASDLANNEGNFVLTQTEWLTIQRNVNNIVKVPRNEQQLRERLHLDANDRIETYQSLLNGFVDVQQHANLWKAQTFPELRGLAQTLSSYGSTIQPRLADLHDRLEDFINNPTDSKRNVLLGLLSTMLSESTQHEVASQAAFNHLQDFSNQSNLDEKNMHNLHESYVDLQTSNNAAVLRIEGQVDAQKSLLKTLHDDYEHYVTVASTAPTYAWIWPFGTIAAGAVATEYGIKATQALNDIHAAETELNNVNSDLQKAYHLRAVFGYVLTNVTNTDDLVKPLLEPVKKIVSHWHRLNFDLGEIQQLVANNTNLDQLSSYLVDADFEMARNSWAEVSRDSAAFLANIPADLN
ncbi:MAG: alpha-xenorhabdolysin family binary toxin subunit A [Pseudobdellovibrionaceae bacterium]|nr:alpha-xenorhabdolysin family binary toxin subunit A [Pseudobdellovibrionaceae bacterium]